VLLSFKVAHQKFGIYDFHCDGFCWANEIFISTTKERICVAYDALYEEYIQVGPLRWELYKTGFERTEFTAPCLSGGMSATLSASVKASFFLFRDKVLKTSKNVSL